LCYTTPREALLSSIFRLISVLHPSDASGQHLLGPCAWQQQGQYHNRIVS
jgi:hypothetical protein